MCFHCIFVTCLEQAVAKQALANWKEEVAVEKAKRQLAASKQARLEATGARAKAASKRPLEDEDAQDAKSVTWFDFET